MIRLWPAMVVCWCAGCSGDFLGNNTWCTGPPSFDASTPVVQMVVGDSVTLRVQRPGVDPVSGKCGVVFLPAHEYVWVSANPLVVRVGSQGMVYGLAPGATTISVTPRNSGAAVAEQQVAVRVP